MVEKVKENNMTNIVIKHFNKKGYVSFKELKIRIKRIDLYFVHKHYPKTIAVELKVYKWRDALRQAYQNLSYAQKSYVGLWHESFSNMIASEINKYGIGVLKIKENEVHVVENPMNRSIGLFPSMVNILNKVSLERPNEFIWSDS